MKIIFAFFSVCVSGCIALKTPDVAHKVTPGETLASIARDHYGASHVHEGIEAIRRANPNLGTHPGIQSNLVLIIPALAKEKKASNHSNQIP